MEQERNNKAVIALLVVIIVILLALVILLATGTISFKSNESNNTQQTNEIIEGNTNTDTIGDNLIVSNNTIDKYLGKWLLSGQDYSNIVIKKNSDNSGYKIDILVNKEADYKDLELNCADNSGACYFSGDASHNYSIMMANDTVMILPDYGTAGYWTFNK